MDLDRRDRIALPGAGETRRRRDGGSLLRRRHSLCRTVLLKFLPGALAFDPIARKRFLREARSAAKALAEDNAVLAAIVDVAWRNVRRFMGGRIGELEVQVESPKENLHLRRSSVELAR